MPVTATKKRSHKRTSVPTTPATPEASTETPVKDLLDKYGFTYQLTVLDITDIDRKKSERNQARIAKPIDEDQVLLYAEQMSAGSKFPPIVVYKDGTSYIVMDGNHRVAAADMADVASLDAYIVLDPSPAQVVTFTYEANTRHGLPTSLKDRLLQAIHLIEAGSTLIGASKQLGIPEQQLRNAVDIHEADKRFSGLGIKKFDRLSTTSKRRLDTIPNDVVLKAAADVVIDASIGGDELTRFVREVNSIKSSEAAQLEVVEKWRASRAGTIRATAGGRVKVPQALTTFQRITSTINRTNVDNLAKHFADVSPDTRAEYVKATAQSIDTLMQVVRALRRVETQG